MIASQWINQVELLGLRIYQAVRVVTFFNLTQSGELTALSAKSLYQTCSFNVNSSAKQNGWRKPSTKVFD